MLGVILGVQRQRRCVLGALVAIGVFGIFFLQTSTVRQQDSAHVDGRRCGENRAAEAAPDQQWQRSRVVEVCVRQDHGVELGRIEGEVFPVHRAQVLVALEQSAVDEQPLLFMSHLGFRSGDGAGGAKEGEVHVSAFRW
jgi:hypothetical protein